jgi:hypothetical protein
MTELGKQSGPVIICFRCCKRASSFLETRVNGGASKVFTFFHVEPDGQIRECTVQIERDEASEAAADRSWTSKITVD